MKSKTPNKGKRNTGKRKRERANENERKRWGKKAGEEEEEEERESERRTEEGEGEWERDPMKGKTTNEPYMCVEHAAFEQVSVWDIDLFLWFIYTWDIIYSILWWPTVRSNEITTSSQRNSNSTITSTTCHRYYNHLRQFYHQQLAINSNTQPPNQQQPYVAQHTSIHSHKTIPLHTHSTFLGKALWFLCDLILVLLLLLLSNQLHQWKSYSPVLFFRLILCVKHVNHLFLNKIHSFVKIYLQKLLFSLFLSLFPLNKCI